MLYVRVREPRNPGFYLPVAATATFIPLRFQKLTPFNFSARDGLAGLRTILRMLTNTPMFPRPFFAGSRASNTLVEQKLCTGTSSWTWLAALVAIAITFLSANVQAQTAQWIKQQGTGGISNGVSSDALQNTYATGMISNPALFDNLTIPCNARMSSLRNMI